HTGKTEFSHRLLQPMVAGQRPRSSHDEAAEPGHERNQLSTMSEPVHRFKGEIVYPKKKQIRSPWNPLGTLWKQFSSIFPFLGL
ncbi:MAG TPA: hypothetical protein VH161_07965, partial [Candidatus Acidoferrales bacterium]|nr:hypothetical protein [Candidatus Acidoferrales bacterium]